MSEPAQAAGAIASGSELGDWQWPAGDEVDGRHDEQQGEDEHDHPAQDFPHGSAPKYGIGRQLTWVRWASLVPGFYGTPQR